ncbi:MAG: GTPase Era [Mycoplasma sp.]
METIKKTVVAILGKPNVGKSTTFNAIQDQAQAIVTYKPQTTRNFICGRLKSKNEPKELIFVDTPGYHNPNNKLDQFLNSEVKFILGNANVACFIVDAFRGLDDEDEKLLKHINNFDFDGKILLINKVDKAKKKTYQPLIDKVSEFAKFDHVLEMSATEKLGIDQLISILSNYCTYDEIDENLFKLPSDDFVAREIVRQSCLELLDKEIPYGINIMVNEYKYDQETNFLNIDADIYVEKESQKSIVIGKQGSMIKQIGIKSREALLAIYDCKINLKLFVKVKNDWRNDNNLVKLMGYKKNATGN